MDQEHTKYLVETFPKLYSKYDSDPKQTAMCWGFECGDGWFQLIKELSEKLEPLDVVAQQVKEKFGGLRFYVEYGTDEVFDIIEEFEDRSFHVCEACGQPGVLRTDRHWYATLCDECDTE